MILNFWRQVKWAWAELSSSWLNLGLTAAIVYLLYKILFQVWRKKDDRQWCCHLYTIHVAFSFLIFFLSEGARTSKPPWAPKAPGKYHLSTPSVTLTPVAWPKNHTWNFNCADPTDPAGFRSRSRTWLCSSWEFMMESLKHVMAAFVLQVLRNI